MGIFDFFKKKPEPEPEKITFGNLDNWIKNKKEENKEKEQVLLNTIKTNLLSFINELGSKKPTLEKININEKKIENKIKFIVKENLSYYIERLERLAKNLRELENEPLNTIIRKIDSELLDFEQKSNLSFQKATFIIGKELGSIKDSINNFGKNLKKIIKENKETLENSEIILAIELNLNELDKINKTKAQINENIEKIKQKIMQLENSVKSSEKEIEEIKNSEEYLMEKSKAGEFINLSEELKNEFQKLKEMIDFKELAKLYHWDPKRMNLINSYKNKFQETFEKDEEKELIALVDKNEEVIKKINELIEKKKELEDKKKEIPKTMQNKIIDLEFSNKKINQEIWEQNNQISKEEKRKEKLESSKNEAMFLIKQELSKINKELLDN